MITGINRRLTFRAGHLSWPPLRHVRSQNQLDCMKTTKQTRESLFILAVLWGTLAPSLSAFAQKTANSATVSAIMGGALSVAPGGSPAPLHLGDILPEGALIKTGVSSAVDLSLGKSGGSVRLTANSLLAVTK